MNRPSLEEIRAADTGDIRDIVDIHRSAFPGFLMTLLGPEFLCRYYQSVLDYKGSIALVALGEEGRLRGFAVGFIRPSGFYRVMKERRLGLASVAFMHVLFRPHLWARVLHNMRDIGNRSANSRDDATVELSSIAVMKGASGNGCGTVLVERFIEVARARGSDRIVLTTDAERNDSVNRFYGRLGFRCERTLFRTASRVMNEYVYDLR